MSLFTGLPIPVHFPSQTITATTTTLDGDLGVIEANPSAPATWTLPTLVPVVEGSFLWIKNISANTITLNAGSGNTINGGGSTSIGAGYLLWLLADGTSQWRIMSYVPAIVVAGPDSSTDNALVRWDGTSGNLVQNSNAILTDAGALSLVSNLSVGGTLGVTGATTLSSTLAVSGNTTVGGTLGVTGATTLSSTLAVSGNTTVGGTLGVTGAATLGSTLAVTGNTTVGGTLGVTGAATLGSTLAVTGNTTVGGTLGVTGDVTLTAGLLVGGFIGASGAPVQLFFEDVAQATSNTTDVAVTANVGTVTMFGDLTTAAGAKSATFDIDFTGVAANANIQLQVTGYTGTWDTDGIPIALVEGVAAGVATVSVFNAGANALNGTITFTYHIL